MGLKRVSNPGDGGVLMGSGVYSCVSMCIRVYPCVSMCIHGYSCVLLQPDDKSQRTLHASFTQ